MTDSFVNLHAHTSYSQLDGASKINEYVARCVELGMPAAAITDHGNLNGLVEFYKACKDNEIKPLLGCEFYFADDRLLKETVKQEDENGIISGSDKRYYHLSVIARNQVGYHNLLKLSSDAYLNGLYYKPRTDYSMLEEHADGITIGTGCLGGPVLQRLLHDDYEGAYNVASNLQDIVGQGNLYVELMDHGLPEQKKTNPYLIDIAKRLGAPACATMDSHYTHKHDAHAHDILLCCQVGAKQSDAKRFRFHNEEYYLKSPEEMRNIFSQNPEVCDNTLLIAESVELELDFDTLHLPRFAVPDEYEDDYDYLETLVMNYLQEKFDRPDQQYYERVAYELGVIRQLNLSSYFLIFWDLVEFTKRERILTGPGRGSAAGSLVSHLLGITKLDPIKYDLLFERFINPDRIALADIDWDIDTRYRDKLINYTREKYGDDRVAQIITFGKIKARTAVRDAARVMGYDYALGDKISKSMPPLLMGFDTPIKACLELDPKHETGYKNAQGFRELYQNDADARRVIDAAMGLEGLVRQDGIHAAAVVIGDQPLENLVPLQKRKDGPIVTGYEKNTIEDLGLLKMDFLGLRNLDVVSDTLAMLGKDFSYLENMNMNDHKVFMALQRGEGIAVFQVESPQMRDLLRRLKPTSIDDIAAVLALYRPGPMAMNMHLDYADRKNRRQPVTYFNENAKEVLNYTYGLMIYQEQVMQVSQIFAGYSMAEADNLRKIMGKKLPEKMRKEEEKFVNGCKSKGYDDKFALDLFNSIEGFAAYGFNKSHAYAYAYISYWTAYMKVNHPREYMACLCSSVLDDLDKTAVYLNETRRMGLRVYPPNLNGSNITYTVERDGIRIGLGAMKNLGEKAADKLLRERTYNGGFTSLHDFARRFNPNIQALKSLAYSGALDEYGTRQGIAAIAEDILKATRKQASKNSEGQASLFAGEIPDIEFTIPTTEFSENDLLKKEKETLGIYVSGHPLDNVLARKTDYTISDLKELEPQKRTVDVLCLVEKVVIKYTKKGDTMAIVNIEDQTGNIETVIFPKSWTTLKDQIKVGAICYVNLRVGTDFKDEKNYVVLGAKNISEREEISTDNFFGVYLPKKLHLDLNYMSLLKGIILSNSGDIPLRLYTKRNTVLKLSNEYYVEDTDKFRNEVTNLFKQYHLEKGKK